MNRRKSTGEEVIDKVDMGASRQVPAQFDTRVPSSEILFCRFSKQVPKHASVEVRAVGLYST